MAQFTQGSAGIGALSVPDVYVQINQPPAAALAGAPTDIIAVVGTGTWGPLNSPVPFSDEAGGALAFGAMQVRKYDMMTQVRACALQGARNFRGVRVSDGTEAAAAATIQTNGGTATARYTGTKGNTLQMTIADGTAPSTKKVTLALPGLNPETFDNIAGTANAAWVAMAAAINAGQVGGRGRSELMVFAAGASTTTPVNGTYTLSGGADGATTINGSVMIGSDTLPRTGMYALRSTGAALFILADCDTSSTWATQLAFALSELMFCVATGPASDTIANHTSVINTAGIDSPFIKVMFGDWIYILDAVNNLVRRVSPQGFYAGRKAVIGPHKSALNKPLYGIVGTEKSYSGQQYATSEIQALIAARTDVICNPAPGGNYFACRTGHNASSDPSRRQETWTTMTNYLAQSLGAAAGTGRFVGELQSPTERREAKNTIGSFLQGEWDAERIGNAQGTLPYSVQLDDGNNPQPQVVLGIQKATVQVQYLSVIEFFLIDFTGGATVQIASQLPLAA